MFMCALHFSFCKKQTASWYFRSDFSLILVASFFHPSVCFFFIVYPKIYFFILLTIQIHSLSSVWSFFFLIPRNQKCSNNNFKQKLSRERRKTDFLENRLDLWVGFKVLLFYFSNDCKDFIWVRCWAFAVDGCVEKNRRKKIKRKKNWRRHGEKMWCFWWVYQHRLIVLPVQLKLASVVMASVGRKSNKHENESILAAAATTAIMIMIKNTVFCLSSF